MPSRRTEQYRCVRCSGRVPAPPEPGRRKTVVLDALRCQDCGASYDVLWGAPFLGGFERADLLSLIEICANANTYRRVSKSEPEAFPWWEELLSAYHRSRRKGSFLKARALTNHEEITTRLALRYREWLLIGHLLKGVDLEKKQVLDVGAGSAFDSYRLLNAGARVTALESNPALMYEGLARLPRARWVGGFSHALPFDAESFDIVFCNAGLHHMRNVPVAIAEMLRVLKPGGLMITASDPYCADSFDEGHELAVFDQNPAVLLGINDTVPRLTEFVSVLATHHDRLETRLYTQGLQTHFHGPRSRAFDERQYGASPAFRLQSRLAQSGKSLDDILEWDLAADAGLLAETSGTIGLKIKKKRSIPLKTQVQPAEGLRASTLVQWLDSQDERRVLAHLARILPDEWVNMPFLQAPHSKFLLLNGWRSNQTRPGVRQAYRRGRWFFRRAPEQTCLDCEILIQGRSDAPPATVEFFADERSLSSTAVPRGVWTAFSMPLPPLSAAETFVAEVALRDTEKTFSQNLIWVRKFELGEFEPCGIQDS